MTPGPESVDQGDSPQPADDETRRRDFSDYISNIYRGRRRRTPAQLIAWIFVLMLVTFLVADALYVTLNLRSSLRASVAELRLGEAAFNDTQLAAAENHFANAAEEVDQAASAVRHPTFVIGRYLPVISDDVRAVDAITDVVTLTSEAGGKAVQGAARLGGTTSRQLARTLYAGGRVQVAVIQQAEPLITDVARLLNAAGQRLEDVPQPHLDTVRGALSRARTQVGRAQQAAGVGADLVRLLPPLLGADTARHYFLAFQSPSEARATGGLIGFYGVLEARAGNVRLAQVAPLSELLEEVTAPRTRTGAEGGTAETVELNTSPDFPAVSEKLIALFEKATGRTLDGVVVTDPVALGYLTEATGPIEGEGWPTPVGPDNAAEVLLHDSYIRFRGRPEARDAFITSVIQQLYAAVGRPSVAPHTLLSSFGRASRSQHLKVFSSRPEEQTALEDLNVGGSIDQEGNNIQYVFHNNLGRNKVDYYFRREIHTDVAFTPDGYALFDTRIEMRNEAPAHGDVPLIRSYGGNAPPGANVMQLNVVLPRGSRPGEFELDGKTVEPEPRAELGFPALFGTARIPAGESSDARLSYELPEATDVLTGGDFTFTLFPQATVKPDRYSISFEAPAGFRVISLQGGRRIGTDALAFSGSLTEPMTFQIEMEPL